MVELTAFRVVQEAITNVVRHARARSARVTIRDTGSVLVVEVRDDGRVHQGPVTAGYGLRGMAERVESIGGELSHGHPSDTGWIGHSARRRCPRGQAIDQRSVPGRSYARLDGCPPGDAVSRAERRCATSSPPAISVAATAATIATIVATLPDEPASAGAVASPSRGRDASLWTNADDRLALGSLGRV